MVKEAQAVESICAILRQVALYIVIVHGHCIRLANYNVYAESVVTTV